MNRLQLSITLVFLATIPGMGCNANLDTKNLVPPKLPALTPTQTQQGGTVASPKPSGTASPTPSGSPSPSPSPTGSPLCPAATQSLSQVAGGSLVQWVGEGTGISSSSLTASSFSSVRLNQTEGLYLSVVTDGSNNAAIGLFHCDSESPTSMKIMDYAFMNSNVVGIDGGDDPSVSDGSSSSVGCPQETNSSLLLAASKSLPAGTSLAQFQVNRVRSNSTESLYLATVLGANQTLFAAVLHCDEKTPNVLDVLGVASNLKSQ